MLPPTSDAVLLDELAQVITGGWQLIDRPQAIVRIPHLIQLADPLPTEEPATVAWRFMKMLDTAFRDAADGIEADEPLLTDDQATGLRILFGVHPSYRTDSVEMRRTNGGALLLGRDRLLADTFYRSHEDASRRLALECLRARYGQEQQESPRRYQSVRRHSSAVVAENCRIASTTIDNTYRALIDDLDVIRTSFTVGPLTAPFVESVTIRTISGVEDYELERRDVGDFSVTFPLASPVAMGALVRWSYERTYHYVENCPAPLRGHVSTIGRNKGYRVSLNAQFLGPPAPLIWCFRARRMYSPGSPNLDGRVTPDQDGRVFFSETDDTDEDGVYGIAWEWQ